ncbi:MAG: single-stranded DNA-binding protein [Nitritalea sp.]
MKNKVQLIGRLGSKIEIKKSSNNVSFARFSLATNTYTLRDGERVEDTQWHQVVAFGKAAETLAQHTDKGHELGLTGRLSYSSYEDKEGIKRYQTDIILEEFIFMQPLSKSA